MLTFWRSSWKDFPHSGEENKNEKLCLFYYQNVLKDFWDIVKTIVLMMIDISVFPFVITLPYMSFSGGHNDSKLITLH
jgi:hypothetical protein